MAGRRRKHLGLTLLLALALSLVLSGCGAKKPTIWYFYSPT